MGAKLIPGFRRFSHMAGMGQGNQLPKGKVDAGVVFYVVFCPSVRNRTPKWNPIGTIFGHLIVSPTVRALPMYLALCG